MGRDFPDWGGQYNNQQFYPLFDMGELAVRLGSIVALDRRGSVFWQYGFEYGIQGLYPTTAGATSEVGLTADYIVNAPFACKLTAGPAAGSFAELLGKSPSPLSATYGISTAVFTPGYSGDLQIKLIIADGENSYIAWVKLTMSAAAPDVEIYTGGAWVSIWPAGKQVVYAEVYQYVKLSFDVENLVYKEFSIGGLSIDLSEYPLVSAGAAASYQLVWTIRYTELGAATSFCHIDNVVITANEP